MNKILVLLLITVNIIGCQKEEQNGYSITAETQGFDDGVIVYVNGVSQSNRPIIIDSTTIKNGKISMSNLTYTKNDLNYLTFKNTPGNVLFISEDNPIKMTIYKDSLRSSIISGGSENDIFFEYLTTMTSYNKQKIALGNKIKIASKLNNNDEVIALSKQQNEFTNKEKELRKEFAQKHPTSLVSIMALTDLINLKIMPAKKIKELYTAVSDSLKVSRLGKNLNRIIASSIGKIDIGSEAEDFTAPTPNGDMLSLKQSMGKITIIDFWASWCKPCRAENPNVVRVYNKYHDKGLNIIGVSLDRNGDHWKKAIADDNLQWSHVSNLKFWQDPIARSYGVRSIPATFILDENGNVIAKNLRGSALENKIAELLGEKTL